MPDKLKMQIDINSDIKTYKVLMSEVIGYYIDIAAESSEEAEQYANLNNRDTMYKRYGDKVVETAFVEIVKVTSIRKDNVSESKES